MLNLVLKSGWPVKAIFAVVFFGLAALFYAVALDSEAQKVQALRDGVPAPVSLNAFDRKRDVHAADEVHVIGWVNPDFNYRLTETRKSKRSSYDVTRRMFVLLGPEDAEGSKIVRAAVLVDESDVDRFLGLMAENVETMSEGRLVFRLNGTAERSPELDDMANDALGKLGVVKAPDFQFIEIWSKAGRAEDLAPADVGYQVAYGSAGLGGFFLLMAVAGFRRRKQRVAPSTPDIKAAGLGPAQPTGLVATKTETPEGPFEPAKRQKPGRPWLLPLLVVGGLVLSKATIGDLLRGEVPFKANGDQSLFAAFAWVLDPTGLSVTLSFFLMTVVVLGLLSKLYRKVFRRPEGQLTLRFGLETLAILAITFVSWIAVVNFAPDDPLGPIAFAFVCTFVAWIRLAVLCLRVVAFVRRKSIIVVADMAAVVVPKPPEPAVAKAEMAPAPTENSGPIKTVPTLSHRWEAALQSGKLLQWAPLGVGLIVMAVSSVLFKASPFTTVNLMENGIPELDGVVAGSRAIIFGSLAFGAVLLLLVSRYAARRNISYPDDPWARLERLAAAERARG